MGMSWLNGFIQPDWVARCSAIPCEFEQSAGLGEWAVARHRCDLQTAAALKFGGFEDFTQGHERHGTQWSSGAALDMQLRRERPADPSLLKRILADVEAVSHIKVE